MGFQRGMLDPLGGEGAFIGHGGLRQRRGDVAEFAMGFGDDVARRVGDAMLRRLVGVDHGRARRDRLRGIDHGGQDLVFDLEPAAAFLGRGFGLGDDGGDLLADEADDVVEHAGVVRDPSSPFRAARSRTAGPARLHRVSTACTPGTASAALLSIEMILACGCGERSILMCSRPSIATSNV